MTNMEFFYLANEQAKRITSIEEFLFGGLRQWAEDSFIFSQLVLNTW